MRNSFKKLFFLFIALLIIGTVVFGFRYINVASNSKTTHISSAPITTPTPEPIKDVQINSADGSMKIVMKKTSVGGDRISYSFFISEISGNSEKLIFTKALSLGSAMSIPQNTWSPDNKYLFLKENDGAFSSFFVFKADGQNFSDGSAYINITDLYIKRGITYSLKDVTGWDSDTLLHVLTSGPSFWFEVPSSSFIQLATK